MFPVWVIVPFDDDFYCFIFVLVELETMLETEVLPKPNLEKVPEEYDPYQCNLSPKFKEMATEDLREDDTIRAQALAQMREWIAKHPHIKKCRTGKSRFLLVWVSINDFLSFDFRRCFPSTFLAHKKVLHTCCLRNPRTIYDRPPNLPPLVPKARYRRFRHWGHHHKWLSRTLTRTWRPWTTSYPLMCWQIRY